MVIHIFKNETLWFGTSTTVDDTNGIKIIKYIINQGPRSSLCSDLVTKNMFSEVLFLYVKSLLFTLNASKTNSTPEFIYV